MVEHLHRRLPAFHSIYELGEHWFTILPSFSSAFLLDSSRPQLFGGAGYRQRAIAEPRILFVFTAVRLSHMHNRLGRRFSRHLPALSARSPSSEKSHKSKYLQGKTCICARMFSCALPSSFTASPAYDVPFKVLRRQAKFFTLVISVLHGVVASYCFKAPYLDSYSIFLLHSLCPPWTMRGSPTLLGRASVANLVTGSKHKQTKQKNLSTTFALVWTKTNENEIEP